MTGAYGSGFPPQERQHARNSSLQALNSSRHRFESPIVSLTSATADKQVIGRPIRCSSLNGTRTGWP